MWLGLFSCWSSFISWSLLLGLHCFVRSLMVLILGCRSTEFLGLDSSSDVFRGGLATDFILTWLWCNICDHLHQLWLVKHALLMLIYRCRARSSPSHIVSISILVHWSIIVSAVAKLGRLLGFKRLSHALPPRVKVHLSRPTSAFNYLCLLTVTLLWVLWESLSHELSLLGKLSVPLVHALSIRLVIVGFTLHLCRLLLPLFRDHLNSC